MKRRTLDVILSVGGLALAVLLLVLGMVMTSNANFAKTYVADQLGQQKITFKTADTLTAEEKESACLVKYAGQPLLTGKQAECYANDFIGLHLKGHHAGATYADSATYRPVCEPRSPRRPQPTGTSAYTQWPMLNHGFPWQARLERGSNVPARRDRQNSRRQGDAGAQESGSLDPREMSKGKDLTLQVQTRCLQHFTFASGDSKRW